MTHYLALAVLTRILTCSIAQTVMIQVDRALALSLSLLTAFVPLFPASRARKKTRHAAGSLSQIQITLLLVAMVVPVMARSSSVRGNDRAGHNRKCNKSKQ